LMEVLHVTDGYLPRCGGIELHVRDLAVNQRRAGMAARVVTATGSGPEADPPWVERVDTIGSLGLLNGRGVREVNAMLERVQPDAVHAHVSVVSPFATTVARLATRQGMPTVVTVHSLWNYPAELSSMACAALGLLERPVLWSAVSEVAAHRVRQALGPGRRVVVVPNAVEQADWVVPPETRPRGSNAAPTIVSVMRLARRKRALALARMLRSVISRLPPETGLRAVIVGNGPQRAELERYLVRHRMTGWVELPGHLDRAAIRAQFARSSLYVAPAKLESFGIAALEARCAGLPVLANGRGGVGEFITDGVDGLLVDDDDAMAAAMVTFFSDPDQRRRLVGRARDTVPDFGWQEAVARSLAVYAEAAELSGRLQAAPPPVLAGGGVPQ
jgi:glycosyltransferase involved in cell wall biosynthesis